LESLTEAFNEVSPKSSEPQVRTPEEKDEGTSVPAAGNGSESRQGNVSGVAEPARRPRRRRAARSPQGSADAQIIKAGPEDASGAQGSSTTAVAAAPAPRAETSAPVILGVGVPASDL